MQMRICNNIIFFAIFNDIFKDYVKIEALHIILYYKF